MKAQDQFFQNINIMLEFNYSHRQTSHQRIWQRGVRVWPVIGTPLQRRLSSRAGSECVYLNKQIPTTKMLIYMHVLVSLQTIYVAVQAATAVKAQVQESMVVKSGGGQDFTPSEIRVRRDVNIKTWRSPRDQLPKGAALAGQGGVQLSSGPVP